MIMMIIMIIINYDDDDDNNNNVKTVYFLQSPSTAPRRTPACHLGCAKGLSVAYATEEMPLFHVFFFFLSCDSQIC